jgi:hypothetical protein
MMPVRESARIDDGGVFMAGPAVCLNQGVENAVRYADLLIDRRRWNIRPGWYCIC